MILEDVVLLTGFTDRAKAYVQALHNRSLVPEMTLLYGQPKSGRPGQGDSHEEAEPSIGEVFLPDLSIPLHSFLEEAGWAQTSLTAESVNDPSTIGHLGDYSPRFAIFCGYGGEIVGADALSCCPFLHIHSGWLPDYRGSTTGYYSWIEEGRLGASAILLDREIDTGGVVMRRRYPIPPPGVDMDYVWDTAIRADLLARVLEVFAESGSLPNATPQRLEKGRTFYVIHPVLKHLALLSQRRSGA